jgi:formate--tetrahydrofolate ligase
MVVGFTYKGQPVRAEAMQAVGAMQLLLRDAIHPNLVQSLEGTPALVHGGPFANIAQGTNTCIATRLALKLADYVVTEAGFATDLGAEKFIHIKCRTAGLKPSTAVIVASTKAIAYHGGFTDSGGLGNLAKHIENIRLFGLEPVVCISNFPDDKPADYSKIIKFCSKLGAEAVVSEHFDKGGAGAMELASAVLRSIEKNKRKKVRFLYPLEAPIEKKIETLATQLYGADGVDFDRVAKSSIELFNKHGFGELPICVAKTQMSLSDDPELRGRPRGFRVKVNELRLSAGSGFIVAVCGNIVTMPGLPKVPAAAHIKVIK